MSAGKPTIYYFPYDLTIKEPGSMTIQQAIEKAIEGGWNPYHWKEKEKKAVIEKWEYFSRIAFLDPLFWQSLGKAGVFKLPEELREVDIHPLDRESKEALVKAEKELWIYEWHRFIDHLAENKDAESFFESL